MDEVEMRFTLVRELMPALGYDAPMVIDMADQLVKFAMDGKPETEAEKSARRAANEAYAAGLESGRQQARYEFERAAKASPNAGVQVDAA